MQNWAGLAVLVSWQILKGSQNFLHYFRMALYHKWEVKNDFAYVLQFFSSISDGPGGVICTETPATSAYALEFLGF